MKYLIFGTGSYLGRIFFEYLKSKKIDAYGVSKFSKNKDLIFTDYSTDHLSEIIKQVNPDFIFDFKTYLVSSNEVYFNESFNKMVESSTNIINAYNIAEVKDISINLISTSLLNYNISTNHPYLKIKNYQEKIYKSIKDNKVSILRIPNIIGEEDVNFKRLIPFCFGSYISNKEIKLNSQPTSLREYIFKDKLLDMLYKSTELFDDNIVLSNFEVIEQINNSLNYFDRPPFKIKWGNNSFNNKLHKNNLKIDNINLNDLKVDFNRITWWYLENSKYVKNQFEKFGNL